MHENSFIFDSNFIIVDEFERILFWVWRIGEEEKTLVEISQNINKAREVVELLQRHSLVRIRKKGRIHLVSLSEKGVEVYRRLREIKDLLGASFEEGPRREYPSVESRVTEPSDSETPSFIVDNPWLKVLAQRGRERLGL